MKQGQSISAYRSMMVISMKSTHVSELQAELAIFFHGIPFLPERTDNTTVI